MAKETTIEKIQCVLDISTHNVYLSPPPTFPYAFLQSERFHVKWYHCVTHERKESLLSCYISTCIFPNIYSCYYYLYFTFKFESRTLRNLLRTYLATQLMNAMRDRANLIMSVDAVRILK
jgi:hypothetical protein